MDQLTYEDFLRDTCPEDFSPLPTEAEYEGHNVSNPDNDGEHTERNKEIAERMMKEIRAAWGKPTFKMPYVPTENRKYDERQAEYERFKFKAQ